MSGPAALHPGAVVHVWDHYVITLRAPAGEHRLSLYSIGWSPELGGGTVCLVAPAGEPARLLADDVRTGERMVRRLRAMPGDDGGLPDVVIPASFSREALPSAEGFRWSIEAASTSVLADWREPSEAMWAQGPAPAFSGDEDIWACFVEAREASIAVDGRALGGRPYEQHEWLPKLGRSLSSAHVALAEVRVSPHHDPQEGPS